MSPIGRIGRVAKKAGKIGKARSKNSLKGANLFRVVDETELKSIRESGAFKTVAGKYEGKQFVGSLNEAKNLQAVFSRFFGGKQSIVGGNTTKSVIDKANRVPFADIPNGTAITIPTRDLSKITPVF